jgi:hypothetical protein
MEAESLTEEEAEALFAQPPCLLRESTTRPPRTKESFVSSCIPFWIPKRTRENRDIKCEYCPLFLAPQEE